MKLISALPLAGDTRSSDGTAQQGDRGAAL